MKQLIYRMYCHDATRLLLLLYNYIHTYILYGFNLVHFLSFLTIMSRYRRLQCLNANLTLCMLYIVLACPICRRPTAVRRFLKKKNHTGLHSKTGIGTILILYTQVLITVKKNYIFTFVLVPILI